MGRILTTPSNSPNMSSMPSTATVKLGTVNGRMSKRARLSLAKRSWRRVKSAKATRPTMRTTMSTRPSPSNMFSRDDTA